MTGPETRPSERAAWRQRRRHAGEGIEDVYNVPGIVLCALAIVALAALLTAAGYGFAGWAVVAGVICVVCAAGGIGWLLIERRRMARRTPPAPERQGH